MLEPSGLEDALPPNEDKDLVIDYLIFEPRSDHGDEPLLEALVPEGGSIAAAGRLLEAIGYGTLRYWILDARTSYGI